MFVKRFVAKDMHEALKKISAEFGPDAVILQNKTIRKKGVAGLFSKKMVEVVAAYEPARNRKKSVRQEEAKPEAVPRAAEPQQKAVPAAAAKETDDEKASILVKQMDELKEAVAEFSNKIRIVNKETTLTFTPEILSLYNSLVGRDVQEDISKEIAARTQDVRSRRDIETSLVAQQLIQDRLGEPKPIKLKKFTQNVLLFVGPTGAGKTTTLAKLAGMLKFKENLDVAVINTDTYRIGAMEQIKIYSEIMDIPLVTTYSPEELKDALASLAEKDVVLIDTAGKSVRDEDAKNDLSRIIKAAGADEVFLVMSVSTGYKACMEIVSSYSFVGDYKLIITKLDEMGSWGNVLNISDYSKKPLAYVTTGQNVPDDISKADMQKLAENIAGKEAAL